MGIGQLRRVAVLPKVIMKIESFIQASYLILLTEPNKYNEGVIDGLRLALSSDELSEYKSKLIAERDRIRSGIITPELYVRLEELSVLLGD